MTIRLNPVRDTISALVGLSSGLIGLGGTAAKKMFIADDSSLAKKVGVGLLATILTGGTGLLPYLIAGPGARHEVQSTKGGIVDARY